LTQVRALPPLPKQYPSTEHLAASYLRYLTAARL
jgi:hypothetical protein